MKKLLILGGTQFIGRNLVERLQKEKDFELTLFNRQMTGGGLFQDVQKIKGDRSTDDIQQITGKDWDFIIDLSCYFPKDMKGVLEQLTGSVKRYIFISTCSVYDNEKNQEKMRTEETPVLGCSREEMTDRSPRSYGNRKAECERILMKSGLDNVIFRPALVYGLYDHTDRFYYWMHQVKNGNQLLLPDKGERSFSITYVEDLVEAIVLALNPGVSGGVYNIISSPQTSIRKIVEAVAGELGKKLDWINASPEFLKSNEISEWTDMPLWINNDYFTYSNQQLQENFDLRLTNLKDSMAVCRKYYDSLNWHTPAYGLSDPQRMKLIHKLESLT